MLNYNFVISCCYGDQFNKCKNLDETEMQVIHVHFHKPGKLIPVGYSVNVSVWDYHNIKKVY